MIREHFRSPVVALARKLAGGSPQFIFSMYERHMTNPPKDLKERREDQLPKTLQKELAFALKDSRVKDVLLGQFPQRVLEKVKSIQAERKISEQEALILGYSYYVLLARWAQHTAQDERIDLTPDQDQFLFAVQVLPDRLRKTFEVEVA
jgi:hypothetical protein